MEAYGGGWRRHKVATEVLNLAGDGTRTRKREFM